jgi:prevent-host-death family protein
MKTVKVSEAKNNLSRYIKYVRRGGRIRILNRDTPVADLVPVETSADTNDDELLLASLERRGLLRRGKRGPLPPELLRPGPGAPRSGVLDALLEERAESL